MKRGLLLCAAAVAMVLVAGACETGRAGRLGDPNVIGPGFGLAVGLTSAAVSRASGGCYAACPVGTACNRETGYCDELPCRGRCAEGEECVKAGLSQKCVAMGLPGSHIAVEPPPGVSRPTPLPEGKTDLPKADAGAESDAPRREAP